MLDPADVGHLAVRYRIDEAAELMQDYPFAPNVQMVDFLESLNFEREEAVELVAFVPMAYLRTLLAREGAHFPEECTFSNRDGAHWSVVLARRPIYEAATDYARYDISRGMLQEHIQGVIFRSCEFAQINMLIEGGLMPHELELEPAEYNVDGVVDEPMPEMEPEEPPKNPWWKLW